MTKIITVWESPGCGKSMLCYVSAKVLITDKRKAITISADPTASMLPIWMPDRILGQDASVEGVLSSLDVNSAPIAGRVAVLKDYPFIGVIECAAGETPFSCPELKYDRIELLISKASRLVDYIILDYSSSVVSFFIPTTIGSAGVVMRALTPDLRGTNYLRARKPPLTDAKFRYNEHLTFAGLVRPFHVLDGMGHLIGGFNGVPPYAKEIERCGTSGEMFRAPAYCNQRYINSIKLVRQRLKIGEASREANAAQEEEILNG